MLLHISASREPNGFGNFLSIPLLPWFSIFSFVYLLDARDSDVLLHMKQV